MAGFAGFTHTPSAFALKAGAHSASLAIPRALSDRADLGLPASAGFTGAVSAKGAPVSQTSQSLQGVLSGSLALYFYNRLWLAPAALDLGNLISEQGFNVSLWNAFFSAKSLASIDAAGAEGIRLDGGKSAPALLAPLEEVQWQLRAGTNGPPVIDGGFSFQVIGQTPLLLRLSGQRIIAFAFAPNWQAGVEESLSFLTEILSSEQGFEQRRALRATPRRRVQAQFLLEGAERRRFASLLGAWGARTFALPCWADAQSLPAPLPAGSAHIPCAPQGFSDLALLRTASDTLEVVEIEQAQANGLALKRATQNHWPQGTQLLPLRRALLEGAPALTRKTDSLWQVQAAFVQNESEPAPQAAPPTLYRGIPVLELPPEESEDITESLIRISKLIDNQSAPPLLIDFAQRPFVTGKHRFLNASRKERRDLLALLHALRGRQGALWLPTFASDLVLAAPAAASALQIDVEAADLARFFRPRALRIETADGQALHRQIQGATALADGLERLALDEPLGIELNPAHIRRISYLHPVRQDSDSVTLYHLSDSVSRCACVFKETRDEF